MDRVELLACGVNGPRVKLRFLILGLRPAARQTLIEWAFLFRWVKADSANVCLNDDLVDQFGKTLFRRLRPSTVFDEKNSCE